MRLRFKSQTKHNLYLAKVIKTREMEYIKTSPYLSTCLYCIVRQHNVKQILQMRFMFMIIGSSCTSFAWKFPDMKDTVYNHGLEKH